jgi:hypothetical protein
MMNFKPMIENLETIVNSLNGELEAVNAQIQNNYQTYQAEYALEANRKLEEELSLKVASYKEQAQKRVDMALESAQIVLDNTYFTDLNANQAAELEIIAKSGNLRADEINGYIRKFKNNGTALRRIEKIAMDNNLIVRGKTYARELSYFNKIKNASQGLVNAIDLHASTQITIALRILKERYNEYLELPVFETVAEEQ